MYSFQPEGSDNFKLKTTNCCLFVSMKGYPQKYTILEKSRDLMMPFNGISLPLHTALLVFRVKDLYLVITLNLINLPVKKRCAFHFSLHFSLFAVLFNEKHHAFHFSLHFSLKSTALFTFCCAFHWKALCFSLFAVLFTFYCAFHSAFHWKALSFSLFTVLFTFCCTFYWKALHLSLFTALFTKKHCTFQFSLCFSWKATKTADLIQIFHYDLVFHRVQREGQLGICYIFGGIWQCM